MVIGATVNKTGYFQFRAEKVGSDTTLSQIIQLVEEASASKAPIAKLADKSKWHICTCGYYNSISSNHNMAVIRIFF